MRSVLRRCALVGSIAIVAILGLPAGAASAEGSDGHTIVVRPGQSIQTAIDTAPAGTTIVVKAGVYKQSVQITTDRLTLRGSDSEHGKTVIEPLTGAPSNACSQAFGPTGVCVLGQLDAQGQVTRSVTGVTVKDLTVQDFAGNGVFGFGTDRLTVSHVVALRNAAYGIARFNSTRSRIADNVARDSAEAAIYVGDSPNADTTVVDNLTTGSGIGVFLRDSTGVTVEENRATGNCIGILALNTGTGAIAAGNYRLRDNSVTENNKACPAGEGPPTSGMGIVLAGTHDVRVEENRALRNRPTGPSLLGSGGIVVVSTKGMGGADPVNNTVVENTVLNNKSFDILYDGTGTGNRFVENRCQTSMPPGLCHKDLSLSEPGPLRGPAHLSSTPHLEESLGSAAEPRSSLAMDGSRRLCAARAVSPPAQESPFGLLLSGRVAAG
ncbi:right-handed parallel beta-helix repeat-containing protein [Candidatus Nephthysia bennettiae]|uniref:Right-handed parallel beta-helix repeat-containing protein n=1 Tax=Candidatus Nephthysia bennettiae TaxID=3127016 RepID=A0A934K3A4_9BACT|nr:right-handed parallel beta-helix repeat-containing protein [Candidatus Dormibacteraeota bacterium]